MNVPEILTRKIGPLPAGAWVLALAGGIGVAVVIRRQASDSGQYAEGYEAGEEAGYESVADEDDRWENGPSATNPGAGNVSVPPWIDLVQPVDDGPLPASPTPQPNPAKPAPAKPAAPTPQQAWRRKAIDALVAKGIERKGARETVDRHLAGQPLGPRQKKIKAKAIKLVGPAPAKRPATPPRRPAAPPSRRDVGTRTNPSRR